MNNKICFLLALAATLLTGCGNKEDEPIIGTTIENVLHFAFFDGNGVDLLNPDSSSSYKPKDIKVYYYYKGTELNWDFGPYKYSDFYTLIVAMPYDTTYLKLSADITDTIISKHDIGENYNILNKVWYNDSLVWSRNDNTDLIRIIKR